MDAGEHDFLHPTTQGSAHIFKHFSHMSAAPRTARDGGYTKSTAIIAAILDFNKSARA
jgi:hypothetical protein